MAPNLPIPALRTPAYVAAREAAALADMTSYGWLRLTGRDRLDFLQRLSTNDFRSLKAGRGLPTVVTNPTGRVIAFIATYASHDSLFVRTAPEQVTAVTKYFNSMIFWQDQIEVADVSATVAQIGILGPDAKTLLERLTGVDLAALAPYAWTEATIAGSTVVLQRGGPLEMPDWIVMVERAAAEMVREALVQTAPVLDPDTLHVLRTEAGIPAWGYELSDQVTPLEAGLSEAISYTKGCYTGQEVIARQTNFDKVTRRLTGLILPLEEANQAWSGLPVKAGAGRPGFIGSVATSPTLGQVIALAIVPHDGLQPGSIVKVHKDGNEVEARVAGLPFVTRP